MSPNPNPMRPEPQSLTQRAQLLLDLRRYSEVLELVRARLREEPNDPRALSIAARAYLGLRTRPAAILGLEAALAATSIAPRDPYNFMLVAWAETDLGHKREAIDAAETAIRIAPDNSDAWVRRTRVDLGFNSWIARSTQMKMDRALSLAPNGRWAHLTAAEVAFRRRKWKQVEQHAGVILRRTPDEPAAQFWLICARIQLGHVGYGVRALSQLVAADPKSLSHRHAIAWAARVFLRLITIVTAIAGILCEVGFLLELFEAVPILGVRQAATVVATALILGIVAFIAWIRIECGPIFVDIVRFASGRNRTLQAWAITLTVSIAALVISTTLPPVPGAFTTATAIIVAVGFRAALAVQGVRHRARGIYPRLQKRAKPTTRTN